MSSNQQPRSQLPNRPREKLRPLSRGCRIQKRPLPRRHPTAVASDGVDPDGYKSSSTGGRTPTCVYVSTKTPFMAIVKRVCKALEKTPQKTKGLSLASRVAAINTVTTVGHGDGRRGGETAREDGVGNASSSVNASASASASADADVNTNTSSGAATGGNEVVVVGTGRAIEKTLNVAAWFDRQRDCKVSLRTRSVGAVDDVLVGPKGETDSRESMAPTWREDTGPKDQARIRMVSCLEVAVMPC